METLKSKWEKFFRTAGIKYVVTSDLAKTADDYMPDFHLPDLDAFVDIRRVGEYSFTDLDTTGDNDMTQVACGEAPWAEYPVERFIEAASFIISHGAMYLLLMGDPYDIITSEIEDAKGVVFDAGMQEGDPPVQMDFMCFLPDSIMVKGFPENTLPLHITTKQLVGAEEFSHFCKTNEAYRARADVNLSKIIEAAAHV